ncbi:DUF4198 domain-containing protein [Altererythrobacter fulvus]|uniref:DUF4198 domain-containing protein n=1 Tax=Caenibius fulvus TaxID=2126012 RepID=UPI00301830B3
MNRKILLAAAAILVAAPLQAHNAWIKPSTTTVAGEDGWVTFDVAASTDVYNADHRPMGLNMIKAVAPDGSEAKIENGSTGQLRSTFDLHLTQQGTWQIGTESVSVSGSYKLGDQEYRVGGRGGPPPGAQGGPGAPGAAPGGPGGPGAPGGPGGPGGAGNAMMVPATADFTPPEGATDIKLNATSNRNFVFVTLGMPSDLRLSGTGLEMEPVTHPADLIAGEPATFRFLVDGKPAAGIEVEATPDGRRFRDDQGTITVTTDAKGEAVLDWPAAGLYWVHASFSDETSPRPGITGRRFQYTANVEVMAP